MKNVAILVIMLAIAAIIGVSCTPRSERYATQHLTRVVILDSYQNVDVIKSNNLGYYKYKVRYVKYDVVDYVLDRKLYDRNDTILVADKYYHNTISK